MPAINWPTAITMLAFVGADIALRLAGKDIPEWLEGSVAVIGIVVNAAMSKLAPGLPPKAEEDEPKKDDLL